MSRTGSVTQSWSFVFAAWLLAASAMLGALFFGEVMRLPPCTLCWYQRICMFPLAFILPFALFPSDRETALDRNVVRAVLPLAGIGTLVATFQVLLVHGIIPERVQPCVQGVSCSESVITWFGFLTIPHLSFLAFSAVATLLVLAVRRSSK